MTQTETREVPVESFLPGDLKRSIISIDSLKGDDKAKIKYVEGMDRRVDSLSGLGVVGSFLEENNSLNQLGVEILDGEYDIEGANLGIKVLEDKSLTDLSIDLVPGTRVFEIENKNKKIRVLFRVPEMDIAEAFPSQIKDKVGFIEAINYLKDNKEILVENTDGDDFLDYSRKIYGIWKYAVDKGELGELDFLMAELYSDVAIPAEANLASLKMIAHDSIKQEESRYPAKNWWMARSLAKKLCNVIEVSDNLDRDLADTTEIIREVSEKVFFPDQLWKFVIEPVMNEYCDQKTHGISAYEKKAFLSKVIESGVTWMNSVPEFKEIVE